MQQGLPSRIQTALAPVRRTNDLSGQTLCARQGTLGEAHVAKRRARVPEEIEERDQEAVMRDAPALDPAPGAKATAIAGKEERHVALAVSRRFLQLRPEEQDALVEQRVSAHIDGSHLLNQVSVLL